jgi:hypothetical protein
MVVITTIVITMIVIEIVGGDVAEGVRDEANGIRHYSPGQNCGFDRGTGCY